MKSIDLSKEEADLTYSALMRRAGELLRLSENITYSQAERLQLGHEANIFRHLAHKIYLLYYI